jgi:hypothetical protein
VKLLNLIESQVAQEPDVAGVDASVSQQGSLYTFMVQVQQRSTGSVVSVVQTFNAGG